MDEVLKNRAAAVRLFVFDVDGVLTDGRLYFTDAGEELKAFDVRDGQGMKMLQDSGVRLAIITSRTSRCVATRAANLGIDLLYQGVEHKLEAFDALLRRVGLEAAAAACMGDDLGDLPLLRRCRFALTVPAASAVVRNHAHYITRAAGGRGAAREACELVMQAQGTLDTAIAAYLR